MGAFLIFGWGSAPQPSPCDTDSAALPGCWQEGKPCRLKRDRPAAAPALLLSGAGGRKRYEELSLLWDGLELRKSCKAPANHPPCSLCYGLTMAVRYLPAYHFFSFIPGPEGV